MNRRFGLFGSCLIVAILAACGGSEADGTGLKSIQIAEPVHLTGYLPVYVAIHEGYYEEAGLDVEMITATGGAHVTTLVSGEVWGNIGGPESNEMANGDSPDPIVSVVNVVNRANVYLMAEAGAVPASDSEVDMAAFLEGKTIAAGRYGGSPNLLTRSLLMNLGLDPDRDVTLEEPADAAAVLSLVEGGNAGIANGAEPQIIEGINKKIWEEPFYGFPSLGDYPYSVISVKKSTIDEEPETVEAFVHATIKGLEAVYEDPNLAEQVLRDEFPTLPDEQVDAALTRAYEDQHWSEDGMITAEALAKPMEILRKTGIYTEPYSYEALVDMEFVESYKTERK